ncbi:MAG TPA: selenoneine biosynthesis selenosugar synthase SenB [Usitatibacteraceae bacterium]
MPPSPPQIIIVTPYLAGANNGNWRTAHRWQSLLSGDFRVIVQGGWQGEACDLLIALHARRSAAAIRRFRQDRPQTPLVVVLTGTDLYKDLATDNEAQRSLELADALIVLQEDAIQHVPRECRRKTHIVYQSAKTLVPADKPHDRLNGVVVGHLRPEKDPETVFRAIESLQATVPIHILHIGAALDTGLAAKAHGLSHRGQNYHYAGAMAHGLTRAAIKRAHLLIHPSIMEGGANVIVEALSSGTAVLASRMSGNVGMLGADYPGYFPVGDHAALAQLLLRCAQDANFLSRLNVACRARAKLFLPSTEQISLARIVNGLLEQNR